MSTWTRSRATVNGAGGKPFSTDLGGVQVGQQARTDAVARHVHRVQRVVRSA